MKITSFGEVLWDDFPDGKVLGGAPLNVAVRLRALGADAAIISRRGDDENGEEIIRRIMEKNVSTEWIQTDGIHATGLVKVMLDSKNSASYEIVYPCAWDCIQIEETALKRVAESDAFIYGSLATRDEISRNTLNCLLKEAKYKIFDVNLRAPHYQTENLLALMEQSDFIKLNDDELYELAEKFGSPYSSLEQNILFLAGLTNTESICVTLGNHGAVLYRYGEMYHYSGFRIAVADTVGAGDSFLAGLVYQLLKQTPPQEALVFACALGALVAARHGATPNISLQEIESFMNPA